MCQLDIAGRCICSKLAIDYGLSNVCNAEKHWKAMPFKPGQSGNPLGRRRGARSKRTLGALQEQAQAAAGENGHRLDPLDFLASVVARSDVDVPLRIQAAGLLPPYRHSRMVARFIRTAAELPVPVSVEQATESIAKIGALAAAGQIALDEANDLVGYQRAFIEAKVGTEIEARLQAIEEAIRRHPQFGALDLTVVGGLPDLPGAAVTMPARTLPAAQASTGPADRDPDPDAPSDEPNR
jgi:hypothetical protein